MSFNYKNLIDNSQLETNIMDSNNSHSLFADVESTSYQKSYVNLPSSSNISNYSEKNDLYSSNYNQTDHLSDIESAIMRSKEPIEIEDAEEITALGQRGIWANRLESENWKGPRPLSEYPLNYDTTPEIIYKKPLQPIEYVQELAVRYLRPPTPPAPGEIIIRQEGNTLAPPAPPLVIRQQPPRPSTPEPLIIREAPPTPPNVVGRKVITISGKTLPPPPRKVVIERYILSICRQ